jgi:hypothetical protein
MNHSNFFNQDSQGMENARVIPGEFQRRCPRRYNGLALNPLADDLHAMLVPATAVSCTAVFLPLPGSSLQSRTYSDLMVSGALISNRSGANSIMIGTLFALLRQAIAVDGQAPDNISEVLIGASPTSHDVHVATTRVPAFGTDLQEPVHMYRRLGPLTSVDMRMNAPPPPPAPIVRNQEVVSVYAEHTITQAFLGSGGPMGIQGDAHFIIIFFRPLMAYPGILLHHHRSQISVNAPPSIPSSMASSPAPRSRESPPVYHAPLSNENVQVLNRMDGSGDISPWSHSIVSRAQSPAPGTNAACTSHPLNVGLRLPLSPPTSAGNLHSLIGYEFEVAGDTLTSARYNGGERELLGMVVNHRSMLTILGKLDLLERGRFADAKTVAFQSGLVSSAADVVKEFGWTPDSFRHKCSWYAWAGDVARSCQWKDAVPGQSF